MKILVITPLFFPDKCGVPVLIHEIYSRIIKLGHTVDLLTFSEGSINNIDGINIYRTKRIFENKKLDFFARQIRMYYDLKKLSKNKKYDLIHSFYVLDVGLVAALAKKLLKIPLVTTLTGNDMFDPISPTRPILYPYMKLITKHVNILTAVSKDQRYWGEKILGRKDIKVLYNGVDTKRFNANKSRATLKRKYNIQENFVFSVSALAKRKNFDDLIKCAQMTLKELPKTTFIIGGKGSEKTHLQQLINQLKLTKNVKLIGYISPKELPSFYATADVYATTTKYEGFGIPYIEAMSSGTPVVTYDAGATKEIVLNNKTGYVTKQNISEFNAKLLEILKNKKLKDQMSASAKKQSLLFTWSITINKYCKIFEELIKNGN
jgi:glycosyltransferase involved in cell wall biosynthesis